MVEGVLYELESEEEIVKMDAFENAPINYSREMVHVELTGTTQWAWTYFANRALRAPGLRPPQSYMRHLLAGAAFMFSYGVLPSGGAIFAVAMFHFFTHAFFKACLFLGSGSVSHAVHSFDMKKDKPKKDDLLEVYSVAPIIAAELVHYLRIV